MNNHGIQCNTLRSVDSVRGEIVGMTAVCLGGWVCVSFEVCEGGIGSVIGGVPSVVLFLAWVGGVIDSVIGDAVGGDCVRGEGVGA